MFKIERKHQQLEVCAKKDIHKVNYQKMDHCAMHSRVYQPLYHA